MTGERDVQERLRRVMSAVFGIEESAIGPDDSRESVTTWDSFGHLQLMMALEEEFQVQFEAEEFASLGSVASLTERLGAEGTGG